MRTLTAISLSGFLSLAITTQAQMVTTTTPFQQFGENYYNNFNLGWGLQGPGWRINVVVFDWKQFECQFWQREIVLRDGPAAADSGSGDVSTSLARDAAFTYGTKNSAFPEMIRIAKLLTKRENKILPKYPVKF